MLVGHQRTRDYIPSTTQSLAADALSRIPSAYFRDMTWATDSIANCTAMFFEAVNGDSDSIARWVRSARADAEAEPLISIVSAVCDSIVADAYRMRGDISGVTTFVASFEREVLCCLTVDARPASVRTGACAQTTQLANALIRTVAAYDRATATHLEATAALSRRIAVAMHLSSKRVQTVEFAARLHDIGNVSVRTEVLHKPGALTPGEWTEMSRHTVRGWEALRDIPQLAHLAPIVRAHHERVDGEGYPDKLSGDAIPLESRIVAVADAFHAMTTARPYRAAMLPNAALRTIARNAGTQFDLDVVDATCDLFQYARRPRHAIA